MARTVVTFKSGAFNTTEVRPNFINPCCFGEDAAQWMMEGLRSHGCQAEGEVDQEDFGWYFGFTCAGKPYDAVVAYRPGDTDADEGDWVCWIERSLGFFASMFGRRSKGVPPEPARAIHRILSADERIREIRWHSKEHFDRAQEAGAAATPDQA